MRFENLAAKRNKQSTELTPPEQKALFLGTDKQRPCHSRAGGNPVFFVRWFFLDPRLRGDDKALVFSS